MMGSRKMWLFCSIIGMLVWGVIGCQGSTDSDEETRTQIEGLQADLVELNMRTAELSGQMAASQATTEALLLAVVGSNQGTAAEAQSDGLSMSLQVALEIIHQDGQPAQSTFIPIDRLAFYPSLEEFGMEWTGDKNIHSQLKMAFLSNTTMDAWQLYYTTDIVPAEAAWSTPTWRRYLISASWQPEHGAQAAMVPGQVQVEQGEKQTIEEQTILLDSPTMLEGLQKLQQAVSSNGSDLTTISPIMFLIHDRFQGSDDLVLIIIDVAVNGPDPQINSPVRQYCSRCQGFWCRWRCWRW